MEGCGSSLLGFKPLRLLGISAYLMTKFVHNEIQHLHTIVLRASPIPPSFAAPIAFIIGMWILKAIGPMELGTRVRTVDEKQLVAA